MALTFAICPALAACAGGGSPAPSAGASSVVPASPVDGVVVHVDATGLGNVTGFTMRLSGGATLALTLGTLENATEFARGHLAEHQATSSPVRAWFVANRGVLTVYRLEDAPRAPSSSP